LSHRLDVDNTRLKTRIAHRKAKPQVEPRISAAQPLNRSW
jgi:hypothetical protein